MVYYITTEVVVLFGLYGRWGQRERLVQLNPDKIPYLVISVINVMDLKYISLKYHPNYLWLLRTVFIGAHPSSTNRIQRLYNNDTCCN